MFCFAGMTSLSFRPPLKFGPAVVLVFVKILPISSWSPGDDPPFIRNNAWPTHSPESYAPDLTHNVGARVTNAVFGQSFLCGNSLSITLHLQKQSHGGLTLTRGLCDHRRTCLR